MKIGICFGGYCPLHKGHLDIINAARQQCDKVFVVVCGYDNEPRANQVGLNLEKRYKIIKDFLTDDVTSVITINDTELGLDESCSLENWRIWTNAVLRKINKSENHSAFIPALPDDYTILPEDLTFYVAEFAYIAPLSTLGYDTHYCKKILPVSGTKCRTMPLKYWNYITYPFKKYLTKRILVIGTASEGKTTLCKNIAQYFNIPWCQEYGRDYMDKMSLTDVELCRTDFIQFIKGQSTYIKNASARASEMSGLVISDTDNLITLMYAHAYANRKDMYNMSMADYNYLIESNNLLEEHNWDHIFILQPNNEFVDDGTRFMGQASLEEREKNHKFLMELVRKYYKDVPITYLNGGEYETNYNTVKEFIISEYGLL